MIRLLPVLTAMVFLLASCQQDSPAASTPTASAKTSYTKADEVAVEQLVQDVFDNIWSGTDTAQVRRYQTEDFVILEHGEVWTNDTIRQWQLGQLANKREDAPKRHNSFEFFKHEGIGNDAWVAYHNTAHFVDIKGDTVGTYGWLESGVATRTTEGWKLKMMHSTRMPR